MTLKNFLELEPRLIYYGREMLWFLSAKQIIRYLLKTATPSQKREIGKILKYGEGYEPGTYRRSR